jgi:hypothetical protein
LCGTPRTKLQFTTNVPAAKALHLAIYTLVILPQSMNIKTLAMYIKKYELPMFHIVGMWHHFHDLKKKSPISAVGAVAYVIGNIGKILVYSVAFQFEFQKLVRCCTSKLVLGRHHIN